MKELSIEQKAKAYDEALARANEMIKAMTNIGGVAKVDDIQHIFPELKESEDERVRKVLINGFNKLDKSAVWYNGITNGEILAWLEKQVQKPQGKSALEASKEEKVDNANKVKPKFKVGDWVVYDHRAYKVVTLPREGCINLGLKRNGKLEFAPSTYCRPWTIADAKDGDVLVDEDNNIGIYKEIEGICWHSYIYLGCDNRLYGFSIGGSHMQSNTKPATKEQCDTLEKAIADAGYIFKESKKIEQKYWSEEDEEIYQSIMDDTVQENQLNDKQTNWLRDIKYRHFPQPKQEWSEEHERIYKSIIYSFSHNYPLTVQQQDFVKSLKPQSQWKPSDEQMEALEHFVRNVGESGYASPYDNNTKLLYSLLSDLKKLKE